MKKGIVLIILLVALAGAAYAQYPPPEDQRGFMFQIGLGGASVDYPEGWFPDSSESTPGADRMTIYLDIGLGFAITQKTYLLFSLSGTGDRLESKTDSSVYAQFNTLLYAVGLRYYPFTTGLVLGADLGAARAVIQGGIGGLTATSTSDWGSGVRFVVGYDFARRLRGFTGILGLAVTGVTIEDEPISTAQIFFSLAWK